MSSLSTLLAENSQDLLIGPMIAAIVAAFGYLLKQYIDLYLKQIEKHQNHRSRLVELGAILKASHAAFMIQAKSRSKLVDLILERKPELKAALHNDNKIGRDFNSLFRAAYPTMTEEEKLRHQVIRSYTEHTLRKLNMEALDWLKNDQYYRAPKSHEAALTALNEKLETMEAHIRLWLAKYDAIIPDYPEHALVYMLEDGIRFPQNIESDVETYLRDTQAQAYRLTGLFN